MVSALPSMIFLMAPAMRWASWASSAQRPWRASVVSTSPMTKRRRLFARSSLVFMATVSFERNSWRRDTSFLLLGAQVREGNIITTPALVQVEPGVVVAADPRFKVDPDDPIPHGILDPF